MNTKQADTPGHVVLGFDGGWRMPYLLRVSAEEAALRRAALAIVMISRAALDPGLSTGGRIAAERRAEASAHRHLSQAAQSVQARYPDLAVTTCHLTEETARAAPPPLDSAQLLVVGTVGQHGRRVFSPDSVSNMLLRTTRGQVLVVPHDAPDPSAQPRLRTVIAGVGEHPSDADVVHVAANESRLRGANLKILHTYRVQPTEGPTQARRRAEDVVARAVADAGIGTHEGLSLLLGEDEAAVALTRQAADADLLVIGSRLGSLFGDVRGSVGLAVIRSLHCPLLVVRDPVADPWSRSQAVAGADG